MVDKAEFVGLFRTLIIIVSVYWGLKWVGRYVFPSILKLFIGYLNKKPKKI